MKTRENERRDSGIIIILILLLGFICIILASGWALRFAPSWRLNTNMGSNLNPNSAFLTSRPVSFIEPLDPAILTNPAWINVFLTPGAFFETRTPMPTGTATLPPVKTNTPISTMVTATPIANPTNTIAYIPTKPPATVTPRPLPTNPPGTPVPSADLQAQKTDGMTTYIPGNTLIYVVIVQNNGGNTVTGAIVTDIKPAQITTWAWACTSQTGGATDCTAAASSNADFTDTVNLPSGASITYTVTANISAAATGNLVNTATITSGLADPVPGNNSATDTDTASPQTDLAITKTDGVATIVTGGTTIYRVRVTNNGPGSVTGAILSDAAVAGLNKTAVACSATPGQCVTAPTVAQLQAGTFALPALVSGQFYEITITANVTALSGSVTNTATIATPLGTTDPTLVNNSASDTDTVTPVADLAITKNDGVASVTAGGTTTYTVRVTNNGPSSVTGATLSDAAVTGLNKTAVACSATPGQCVTAPTVGQLEGGLFALPALVSGQFYEITITANVTALSGSVTNTATVATPLGTTDSTLVNNSASDTDTVSLVADLQITKNDFFASYPVGGTVTYTITVTNNGPNNVIGAVVTDNIPPQITTWGWACVQNNGATGCDTVAGSPANFTDSVDLPNGASIVYTVTANISASATGNLVNTATVTEPLGVTDPNAANNSATDTDYSSLYGNIGPGQDGNIEPLTPADSPLVLALSPQVQVNGDIGVWDIIYYEEAAGIGIDMDQIILEVGDGTTWYTILNWGDGIPDSATNIPIPLGPPNPTTCAGEPDNCSIDASFLDLGTGIRIDLDLLGIPAGTYPFIRITVTSGVGIDGIYVVP